MEHQEKVERLFGYRKQLRRGFTAIEQFWQRHAALSFQMAVLISRRVQSALIEKWVEYARITKAATKKMKRCAIAIQGTDVRRGFLSWRDVSSDAAYSRLKLSQVVASMLNRRARIGFTTWHTVTVALLTSRQLMTNAANALRHVGLRRAVSTWVEIAVAGVETKRRM